MQIRTESLFFCEMSSLETVTIYNLSLPKRFSYRQLDAVMILKPKQRIKQRKCSEVPVDRAEISLVNTPYHTTPVTGLI